MSLTVYGSSTYGEAFNKARTDTVSLIDDCREELNAEQVTPNLTAVLDNHFSVGPAHPYATVGITGVTFEYLSKAAATYDLQAQIFVEVWFHFSPLDGQYDERLKWTLLNSVVNYIKNTGSVSSNLDIMWVRGIEGDRVFPVQTTGAVLTLELWKVISG